MRNLLRNSLLFFFDFMLTLLIRTSTKSRTKTDISWKKNQMAKSPKQNLIAKG